jgi:hypothetical protein
MGVPKLNSMPLRPEAAAPPSPSAPTTPHQPNVPDRIEPKMS